jgi:sulfopyruvate decarboxylase TPP-binding subunit
VISGHQIADVVAGWGVTHVIWLPDSMLGTWEESLDASNSFDLIRVCREGEAWPLAAGLYLGGKSPLLIMQSTGFFESGDAMRNVSFDLAIPVYALVGYRSYLLKDSPDTAKKFIEPIVNGWGLSHQIINGPSDLPKLSEHYQKCQVEGIPGIGLIAEGAG